MIHKLLSTSTASAPTGQPMQEKLFRVPSGPFAGRLIALYARTPSVLSWSRADAPYTSWTAPADFVTEAADEPFTGVMDRDGHLYVAYTQQTTLALRCVKLTFAGGTWATQTAVTVYDSGTSSNRYPAILKDLYDRIWIAWTRDDAGTTTVRVKNSVDDGQTFGTGGGDAGTDLSGAVSSCYARLTARSSDIHCLFTADGTVLKNRRIDLDAAIWGAAETLYTGTGIGADFRTALSPEGMLGVVFAADGALLYREFDGATWGALGTVSSSPVRSPALHYVHGTAYVTFLQSIGSNQNQLFVTHRTATGFTTAAAALVQEVPLATLFCYDADAGTAFADLTATAASQTGADVYHPTSGALLAQPGDTVYFGSDDRFSRIRSILSTPGTGGTVEWSYWDGTAWALFIPDSGAYHFDSANTEVRLFADGLSSPADWQKTAVNGVNRYWIRAVVQSAFTTPPVGSQLTAVGDISELIPAQA